MREDMLNPPGSATPAMPTQDLRVVVADDEPLARLLLRQRLAVCKAPGAVVVAEAGHAGDVLRVLAQETCDAVLLDIRMPGVDGLQLARQLAAQPAPPAVIFVSAYEAHALEAFEVQAVDYLTKPVAVERLQQALQRAADHRDRWRLQRALAGSVSGSLVITDRQHLVKLPQETIILLRAAEKRVLIVTRDGEHETDESLAELEPRLGAGFVRVHRNAIVASHAARELQLRAEGAGDDGWMLRLVPGDHWVSVSRRQLALVRAALTVG
jgi:two-component system, LytTR family, response regulator AlgR